MSELVLTLHLDFNDVIQTVLHLSRSLCTYDGKVSDETWMRGCRSTEAPEADKLLCWCCNTCKRRAVKQRHREAATGWMLRKLGSTPQRPGGSAEHSYAVPASSSHRRGGLDKIVV